MRRDAGLNLVELKIVVVIIVVLGVIAVPSFIAYQKRVRTEESALACVAARAAGQKDPCAAIHAEPAVRLEAGTLRQTLPPPGETADGLRVEAKGDVLHVLSWGHWSVRWIAAPLLALMACVYAFGAGWEAVDKGDKTLWVACGILVLGALAILAYNHRVVVHEIDGPGRRVVRRVRAWGIPCGTSIYEGVVGVAAVKTQAGYTLAAFAPGPVPIASLPEASLGVAARLQAAFK